MTLFSLICNVIWLACTRIAIFVQCLQNFNTVKNLNKPFLFYIAVQKAYSKMYYLLSALLQTDLATCNIALLLPPDWKEINIVWASLPHYHFEPDMERAKFVFYPELLTGRIKLLSGGSWLWYVSIHCSNMSAVSGLNSVFSIKVTKHYY